MKYISDRTGRFPERPFYEIDELNALCEKTVFSFLSERYSKIEYPITTGDLTVLIERNTSDFDEWADLSDEGPDVEGVTEFLVNDKPRVKISETLQISYRENRLRSTLAHELGHVILHDKLWPRYQGKLFDQDRQEPETLPHCKRDTILGATQVDWLEWQAGFASGAILIPITPLNSIVRAFYSNLSTPASVNVSSPLGQDLIYQVQKSFQVSFDAARVRLLQLNYLNEAPSNPFWR